MDGFRKTMPETLSNVAKRSFLCYSLNIVTDHFYFQNIRRLISYGKDCPFYFIR